MILYCHFPRKYRSGTDWRRINSIILVESGLAAEEEEEETGSEYSGDVTSWWSREDSIEVLSSVYGTLSLEIPARTAQMMWTKDNLCRSFGVTRPRVTALSSLSTDLGCCDNYREVFQDQIENNFESETVDSIEYISLYHDLSQGSDIEEDARTLVMYLSSESQTEEEVRYELGDVIAIWHKLHQYRHLVTDEVFR